jgi:hypothetical protein
MSTYRSIFIAKTIASIENQTDPVFPIETWEAFCPPDDIATRLEAGETVHFIDNPHYVPHAVLDMDETDVEALFETLGFGFENDDTKGQDTCYGAIVLEAEVEKALLRDALSPNPDVTRETLVAFLKVIQTGMAAGGTIVEVL